MKLRLFVALAGLALLASCAQINVKRVTDPNSDQEGIRYWRPAPYLVVAQHFDANGRPADGVDVSLLWLPDHKQEYAISETTGFGSVTMNPTLQDGWNLTGFSGTADSKTAENLNAIASLVKSLIPAGILSTAETGAPPAVVDKTIQPGIYRLDYDASGQVTGIVLVTAFPPLTKYNPGSAPPPAAKPPCKNGKKDDPPGCVVTQ